MSDNTSVGSILRKIIGWFLVTIASLAAASQVISLVLRMRPLLNGVGYLIFSAGVLTLGVYLVWKPLKGWRYVLAGFILIVIGVIVVQTSLGMRFRGEKGGAESDFQLGRKYAKGDGVAKDYAEAMKWYRKAADNGHARAQFAVGSLYHQGHGVTRDYAEAARYTRKAAEAGLSEAQFALGTMYDLGEGFKRDPAEAFAWVGIALFTAPSQDTKLEAQIKLYLASLGNSMTPEQLSDGDERLEKKKKQFGIRIPGK